MNFSELTDIGRALFIMVVGLSFVFTVQIIFYLIIKLYPKGQTKPVS